MWSSASKQGSDPRRSPLREVSWGWSHASDANEARRPRPGAGHKEIDGHRAAAREKRCPTLGSDRNVAQQHARAATKPAAAVARGCPQQAHPSAQRRDQPAATASTPRRRDEPAALQR